MASSNSLQPIRHHYHHHTDTLTRPRRHSLDNSLTPHHPPPSSFTSSSSTTTSSSSPATLFLKRQHHSSFLSKISARNILSTFSSAATAFTGSRSTTTSPPTTTTTFDALTRHLSARDFREADEETRRLLIQLAGESAQKRGYVYFSEVQFIAKEDLKTIDKLWREHTDNRYGYSVQRRIWKKLNSDFTRFFINVGWMKRLENSEIEQYNYRSFPTEFIWELNEDTPDGHLPLTNALRGTQLLTCIFNHPAFVELEEEEEAENGGLSLGSGTSANGDSSSKGNDKKPLSKLFKPDYSF